MDWAENGVIWAPQLISLTIYLICSVVDFASNVHQCCRKKKVNVESSFLQSALTRSVCDVIQHGIVQATNNKQFNCKWSTWLYYGRLTHHSKRELCRMTSMSRSSWAAINSMSNDYYWGQERRLQIPTSKFMSPTTRYQGAICQICASTRIRHLWWARSTKL